MSTLRKLSVHNIRRHDSFTISFPAGVSVITGSNGSGKTSLLEAIYIALQGSSFRGADKELIKTDQTWWRIEMSTADERKRTVTFNSEKATGKKQFTIDGVSSYRLSQKHKYPVVLFEPDDLRLLSGSPARRRLYLDRLIAQVDPSYATTLRRYERALRQRNALLKQYSVAADDLFAWNVTLSEYGTYIIERRIEIIERINQRLNDEYSLISPTDDTVAMHYSHTYIGDIKTKLLAELHASADKDKIVGYTSVGPHRHDLIVTFNGVSASEVTSRGEARTIVLALKFIEAMMILEITSLRPVILFDDVFSELDEHRQMALSKLLNHQIIITSTSGSGYEHEHVLELV